MLKRFKNFQLLFRMKPYDLKDECPNLDKNVIMGKKRTFSNNLTFMNPMLDKLTKLNIEHDRDGMKPPMLVVAKNGEVLRVTIVKIERHELTLAVINNNNHQVILEVRYDKDSLRYDAEIIEYKLDKEFSIPVYVKQADNINSKKIKIKK